VDAEQVAAERPQAGEYLGGLAGLEQQVAVCRLAGDDRGDDVGPGVGRKLGPERRPLDGGQQEEVAVGFLGHGAPSTRY
jgi:hypothetical protein